MLTVTVVPDGGAEGRAMRLGGGDATIRRTGDGCRLSVPGIAEFDVSDRSPAVRVMPAPGLAAPTLRHSLMDHAIPVALAAQGELVLHASAVVLPTGAVIVLGPSGSGKSTLAAAFALRGRTVLCDDGARVVEAKGKFSVVASYPGLRLWPDGVEELLEPDAPLDLVAHDSDKRRWVPDQVEPEPAEVVCVVALDEGQGPTGTDAVVAERLSQRDAAVRVFDQSYRLPGAGAERVRSHFDRIARLAESCPAFRLRFPYEFDHLDEVVDRVEQLARGGG